jgi:hypothetical protein
MDSSSQLKISQFASPNLPFHVPYRQKTWQTWHATLPKLTFRRSTALRSTFHCSIPSLSRPKGAPLPNFLTNVRKITRISAHFRTSLEPPSTLYCHTAPLLYCSPPPGGVGHSGTFWDISDINLRTNGLAKGLTGRVGCPVPKLSPRRLTSRGRLGKNRGGQRL